MLTAKSLVFQSVGDKRLLINKKIFSHPPFLFYKEATGALSCFFMAVQQKFPANDEQ